MQYAHEQRTTWKGSNSITVGYGTTTEENKVTPCNRACGGKPGGLKKISEENIKKIYGLTAALLMMMTLCALSPAQAQTTGEEMMAWRVQLRVAERGNGVAEREGASLRDGYSGGWGALWFYHCPGSTTASAHNPSIP